MSSITDLDTSVLDNYTPMSNSGEATVGGRIESAAETLAGDLSAISYNAFYSDDESTAHAVIDALHSQILIFNQLINASNQIFDSIIDDINVRIIAVEDDYANEIKNRLG